MPQGDTNTPDTNTTTEVKWVGEEKLFSIGDRPVKIWELIVGLIILSMILPFLFRGRRNGGGYNGGGRR